MARRQTPAQTKTDIATLTGAKEVSGVEVAHAMYKAASPTFKATLGDPSETNSLDFMNGLLQYPDTLGNEWITLATRIGRTIAHKNILKNSLAPFKMDNMRLGYTLEEYFVDVAEQHDFSYDGDESPFAQEKPNIKTMFHVVNRKAKYKQSISEDQLRPYFITWDGIFGLVTEVVNALMNGDNKDEYNYMKSAIVSHFENGYMKIVKVPEVTDRTTAEEFATKVIEYVGLLQEPTNEYNAMGVFKQNDVEDIYLILTARSNANVQTKWFVPAFQMAEAEFKVHVLMIPTLPNTAGKIVEAFLVDRELFRFFDQLYTTKTIYDPDHLRWIYYLHHHEIISTSRFANAIAFVSGDITDGVTAIYVNPQLVEVKQGESKTVDVAVQTTGISANKSITAESDDANVTATLSEDFKKLTIKAVTVEAEKVVTVTIKDTVTNVNTKLKVLCEPA